LARRAARTQTADRRPGRARRGDRGRARDPAVPQHAPGARPAPPLTVRATSRHPGRDSRALTPRLADTQTATRRHQTATRRRRGRDSRAPRARLACTQPATGTHPDRDSPGVVTPRPPPRRAARPTRPARPAGSRLIAVLAEHDLRLQHFAVLMALADFGPLAQHELAERLGLNRSHRVGYLDEIQDRGLVGRRRDPADRRRQHVTLTEDGAALVAKLVPVVQR